MLTIYVLLKNHVADEEDIIILPERIENKSFYPFNQFSLTYNSRDLVVNATFFTNNIRQSSHRETYLVPHR